MIPRHPFDRADLPHAEVNVDAPVAVVFGLLDDIPAWPGWLAAAPGDVRTFGDGRYELDLVWDDRQSRRRLEVTARGPVHTLFVELVDVGHLYFRTRPSGAGTHVDIVLDPDDQRRWNPLARRRRQGRQAAWLDEFARDLGRHAGATPDPSTEA